MKINRFYYICISFNLKKLKNNDIGHYTFHSVHKFEMHKHIKYYRDVKDFTLQVKMGFSGFCRSINTLYGKYYKPMELINEKEMPQYIINQIENDIKSLLCFFRDNKRDLVINDIQRLSLFLFSRLS